MWKLSIAVWKLSIAVLTNNDVTPMNLLEGTNPLARLGTSVQAPAFSQVERTFGDVLTELERWNNLLPNSLAGASILNGISLSLRKYCLSQEKQHECVQAVGNSS